MKNKKIKIIYILTGLHTGGAEVLLRDFLKKLDKDRFDPLVVSIMPGGEIAGEIARAGTRVVSLNIKRKWNFFSLFFKFRKVVKREKPDLIHAHLFHACIVSRFIKIFYKNIITVSTIHNESFGPRIRDFIMRFTDRWSDF